MQQLASVTRCKVALCAISFSLVPHLQQSYDYWLLCMYTHLFAFCPFLLPLTLTLRQSKVILTLTPSQVLLRR